MFSTHETKQPSYKPLSLSLFHSLLEEVIGTRLLGDTSQVRVLVFSGEGFPPLSLLARYKTDSVSCEGVCMCNHFSHVLITSGYFHIMRWLCVVHVELFFYIYSVGPHYDTKCLFVFIIRLTSFCDIYGTTEVSSWSTCYICCA